MERRKVTSSNIAAVGYDSSTQTLEIEFHGGGAYRYFDVPETVYNKLMEAPSVGKAAKELIIGHYRTEKVGAKADQN